MTRPMLTCPHVKFKPAPRESQKCPDILFDVLQVLRAKQEQIRKFIEANYGQILDRQKGIQQVEADLAALQVRLMKEPDGSWWWERC